MPFPSSACSTKLVVVEAERVVEVVHEPNVVVVEVLEVVVKLVGDEIFALPRNFQVTELATEDVPPSVLVVRLVVSPCTEFPVVCNVVVDVGGRPSL